MGQNDAIFFNDELWLIKILIIGDYSWVMEIHDYFD